MQAAERSRTQPTKLAYELAYSDAGGASQPLPVWASWFLATGQALTCDPSAPGHRRTVAITVPDRRFAAVLVAHGIVVARCGMRVDAPVADRFDSAVPGDSFLTWIDSDCNTRFGKFLGIERGMIEYVGRERGGWGPSSRRLLDMAGTFWPASEDEGFVGRQQIANCPGFVAAASGFPAETFAAQSDIDTIIIGTATEIETEMNEICFVAGDSLGALLDTVRPRDFVAHGQHHRSAILPATSAPDATSGSSCHGPAVFDGGAAYLRHRDSVETHTQIVILDRWHPRSEEAADTARIERNETWIEAPMPSLDPVPSGIELFAWTEEW